VRHPTLGIYRQLVDHATNPGNASAEAIAYLQGLVGSPIGTTGHRYPADPLIEVLDHEGRHDEAWALYLEHGCDHDLAMRLAKRREAEHPLDAVAVYERDVERHIDRKNKTGYRTAVRQLVRIHKFADQAGHPVAAAIIERVRTEHRQKRNLVSLLDDARPALERRHHGDCG
jgi:hemerythrin-like domain-containing protein